MQQDMKVRYEDKLILDRVEYHYPVTAKIKEEFWCVRSELGIYAGSHMHSLAGGVFIFYPHAYEGYVYYEGQEWNWDKEWLEDIVEDRDKDPIPCKIYRRERICLDEDDD
jgi:hypothetical protein